MTCRVKKFCMGKGGTCHLRLGWLQGINNNFTSLMRSLPFITLITVFTFAVAVVVAVAVVIGGSCIGRMTITHTSTLSGKVHAILAVLMCAIAQMKNFLSVHFTHISIVSLLNECLHTIISNHHGTNT